MKPHPIVGIGAGIVTNFFGMEGKPLDGPTPIEVSGRTLHPLRVVSPSGVD